MVRQASIELSETVSRQHAFTSGQQQEEAVPLQAYPTGTSSSNPAASRRDRSHLAGEELKRRLSEWSESAGNRPAREGDDDEDGEEYELLLDPNLPEEYNPGPGRTSPGGSSFDDDPAVEKAEEEDSPYPEVRASVRNYDEDMPCNTVRAWVIGLALVFVGASMNTLFSLRYPTIGLGPLIAQIIAWPIGHGWARFLPARRFRTFGISWSLNPGPFNIKEHSIIVVMAAVSFSVAYATDILLAQIVFYKQDFGIMFQLLLVISTQSLGYGIAGVMRRFLGTYFTYTSLSRPLIHAPLAGARMRRFRSNQFPQSIRPR